MKLIKKVGIELLFFLMIILVSSFVIAQFGNSFSRFGGGDVVARNFGGAQIIGSSVNPQFNNPSFFSANGFTSPDVYWPQFNSADCRERQDIVLQIVPGGCSPNVVRSDLLEEQNVPVFCKVMAIQVNPLIDLSRVRSLRFTGQLPKGVSGISYFPARAAVRSQSSLVGSPIDDNLGYLVVVLSRNEIEGEMPDFVEGNITAVVDYDIEGAFGIGVANFYAGELSDEEWARDYEGYSFWNGKGYVRADSVEPDRATISIYRDVDSRQASLTLARGETSRDVHLGGFYCSAGMNIRLDEITAPVDSALIQISNRGNSQQMWVARGDRILDGKCSINQLDAQSGGGRLGVSCPVKNGRFELILKPGKANFNVDGSLKDSFVGEEIKPGVYLGYLGQYKNEKFAVLVHDSISLNRFDFEDRKVFQAVDEIIRRETGTFNDLVSKIESAIKNNYRISLRNTANKFINDNVKVEVLRIGDGGEIGLNDLSIAEDRDYFSENVNEQERLAKEYYDFAVRYYQDLADLYPNEKRIDAEDSYAASGLYDAGVLAREFGLNEQSQEFFERIKKEHSGTSVDGTVDRNGELLRKYNTVESKAYVLINNEQYFIDLLDFRKPRLDEASVDLLVDNNEIKLGLNGVYTIEKDGKKKVIQVKEIKSDSVLISYGSEFNSNSYNYFGGTSSRLDPVNNQAVIEDIVVRLLNINLKNQVRLTINPQVFGPRTESSFKFKIGIEKRGIKLSPEKTEELIHNLDNSIDDWNNVNDKLGNVVSGLKGACFATSAVLMAKSLIDGFSGKALARSQLMRNAGGWNEKCEELVNNGQFVSVQSCLLENNDAVEKDVELFSKEIDKTNKILEDIQKNVGIDKTDLLDFQGQTDVKKVEEDFKKRFDEFCSKANGGVVLPDRDKSDVGFSKGGICDYNTLTHEQRRDIMTLFGVRNSEGSDVLKEMANKELGRVVLDGKNFYELNSAREKALEEAKKHDLGLQPFEPIGDSISYGDIKTITRGDIAKGNVYKNFKEGESVIRLFIPSERSFVGKGYKAEGSVAGREVIIKLERSGNNDFKVDPKGEVFLLSGEKIGEGGSNSVIDYMGNAGLNRLRRSDRQALENRMKDINNLKVEYFERAPYKGLPSLIPFDVQNGWYVKLTYVLSGFGRPYDDSGRAVNYYICNVGENGRIDFKRSADDICRYYNGNTADLNFPGLSESESRRIIGLAQQSLSEASRQYGNSKIVINGQSFGSGISFGGEEGSCSDFMSAQDCHIMFNVCDPVMCPSSRCDLGGHFRVDNVVQSGIVGSLMLCLPNAQEGIVAPICLSGVHAGVDGFVSILNSTQACLQESLETGRNVGICDEIKSVYLCELFWREAAPLMEVAIPRLIESFYSQGVRGGGEYLSVQGAWDNLQENINYFRNDYAVNSVKAFNLRSTEEIGGEVCKAFVSASYPASADFFDNLLEPDSPVQYSAWFSEDILTTATIPSTSHYKVYYHIFAGRDFGAQYVVFLKDLPESNLIHSNQVYIVDRGYIGRGGSVDKARDFSAVSGYKQLCISINGQEECGFGKVSTSFFLNSLSDQFAKEQLTTGIKSEKECVAGTPSLYSLIQPNIGEGVDDLINPELYNNGLIRVCSTHNPGKQVDARGDFDSTNSTFDRWKDVGYCDDPSLRCWLDSNSVKDVVKNTYVEEQILDNVNLGVLGEEGYLDDKNSNALGNEIMKLIDGLRISSIDTRESVEFKIRNIRIKLDRLVNVAALNVHRARGLYMYGRLYSSVARGLFPESRASSLNDEVSSENDLRDTNVDISDDVLVVNKIQEGEFAQLRGGRQLASVYDVEGPRLIEYFSYDSEREVLILSDGSEIALFRDNLGRIAIR